MFWHGRRDKGNGLEKKGTFQKVMVRMGNRGREEEVGKKLAYVVQRKICLALHCCFSRPCFVSRDADEWEIGRGMGWETI